MFATLVLHDIMLLAISLGSICGLFVHEFVVPRVWFRRKPKLHGEFNFLFSEDGIKAQGGFVSSIIAWALYTKVTESKRFYFLVYGLRAFNIIPKRAFAK